jgi:hypothetical protein
MKRLSSDALEALAYAKHRPIEFDAEENIAVLTVGRDTYYAVIPAAVDGAR